MSRPASDYWIIRLDGAYAVRSARGVELEGIPSYGDAEAHILDLEDADRIEAEEAAAALADYETTALAEHDADYRAECAMLDAIYEAVSRELDLDLPDTDPRNRAVRLALKALDDISRPVAAPLAVAA